MDGPNLWRKEYLGEVMYDSAIEELSKQEVSRVSWRASESNGIAGGPRTQDDVSSFSLMDTHSLTDRLTTALPEPDADKEIFRSAQKLCNGILIPCILSFGIIGNLINVAILCQRRFQRAADKLERCAAHGFLFLAASDLLFCALGLPQAFLGKRFEAQLSNPIHVLELIYGTYKTGLFNVFLFTSTWSTVVIALERYLVVLHPLQARSWVRLRRNALYHGIIFLSSLVINLPYFLYARIRSDMVNNKTLIYYDVNWHSRLPFFDQPYKIFWSLIGALIPMAIMCYCYVNLLVAIYRSRARGMLQLDKYVASKITLILVLIVTLYFVLVCPSVVTTLSLAMQPTQSYQMLTASVIANLLQATNFAINFLLYASLSPKFRAYLRCRGVRRSQQGTPSPRRYQFAAAPSPHRRYKLKELVPARTNGEVIHMHVI